MSDGMSGSNARDAARWFAVSEAHLETAQALAAAGRAAACAFYAQQAAEAALKALVLARGAAPVDWTGQHNLIELVEGVRRSGLAIPADLEVAAERLSMHYEAARYPAPGRAELPSELYDHTIAALALEDARMIVEFARAYL